MDAEMTALLQRTSARPSTPVEPSALRAAASRRTSVRRVATGLGGLLVAVALVPAALIGLGAEDSDVAVIVEPASDPISFDVRLRHPDRWIEPASQTEAEARRDAVPVSLARVPTEIRVPDPGPTVPARDGLRWVLGPGEGALAEFGSGCHNGELCAPHYREFLLVDEDGQIILAHALPGELGAGTWDAASDGSGDLIGWFGPTLHSDGSLQNEGDVLVFRFGTVPGEREVLVYPGNDSPFVEEGLSLLSPDGEPPGLPGGWAVMSPEAPLPRAADPGRNAGSIDTEELEELLDLAEGLRRPAGQVRATSELSGLEG